MSSVKLLKGLKFAEKINESNAVSEPGKEILSKYRGFCYQNAPTCTVVNNFVREASKCTFDTGLQSILESVMTFIGENKISWKLASACEGIVNNNSHYGYIAKLGVEQVGKLLEMNESEVVSYIKAGALKNVQYIPEFRSICKEIYRSVVNEVKTPQFNMTSPVSYVFVEGMKQFFNVLGKTFVIDEGQVSEAVCSDKNFHEINNLLESFTGSENGLSLDYNTSFNDKFTFTLKEAKENEAAKLELYKNGTLSETFDSVQAFNEYANNLSKVIPVVEKMRFLNTAAVVSRVFENIENICALDSVRVVSSANGCVLAITEAENNVNVTVFRSYNQGTSSSNYEFMNEALNNVAKLTGIDLKSQYAERIAEDVKKSDPEAKEIQEQLTESKKAQVDIRKKKIAMLAEQYKNDPAKIAFLNTIARELSLLES